MLAPAIRAVFWSTAVAIVVIVALWVFPGFLAGGSQCPVPLSQGPRPFCAETVTLVGQNCTSGNLYGPVCPRPTEFTFQGVWFQVFPMLGNQSVGPDVYGYVNESGGPVYTVGMPGELIFALHADPLGPSSINWTSQDGNVTIEWQAPFVTVGADSVLRANLTFGVYFGPGVPL